MKTSTKINQAANNYLSLKEKLQKEQTIMLEEISEEITQKANGQKLCITLNRTGEKAEDIYVIYPNEWKHLEDLDPESYTSLMYLLSIMSVQSINKKDFENTALYFLKR